MTDEMTDIEMMWLRTDIEYHTTELRTLQEKYRGQTGKNYTPEIKLTPISQTVYDCRMAKLGYRCKK